MSTNKYHALLLKHLPHPIHSDQEYRRALALLEEVMEPRPDSAQGQFIELLSTLIESYESRAWSAPRMPPARMLEHLLDARDATCAEVSRETGVAAATLSNVLAGRRSISKASAWKLAAYFHVPAVLFLESPESEVSPQGRKREAIDSAGIATAKAKRNRAFSGGRKVKRVSAARPSVKPGTASKRRVRD